MKISIDFSGIFLLLTIVLILLKIAGITQMSWVWVFCPLWISIIVAVVLSLLIAIVSNFD